MRLRRHYSVHLAVRWLLGMHRGPSHGRPWCAEPPCASYAPRERCPCARGLTPAPALSDHGPHGVGTKKIFISYIPKMHRGPSAAALRRAVLIATALVAAAPAAPWTRRLSEVLPSPPGDSACTRLGFAAGLACPELTTGGDELDIVTICSTCGGLVQRLGAACAESGSFPAGICGGDCAALGAEYTSPVTFFQCYAAGDACWNGDATACPHQDCVRYAHCYDWSTGERLPVATTPSPASTRVLSTCAAMRGAYDAHGCCEDDATSSPSFLYVAI